MQAPPQLICKFVVNIGLKGYEKMLNMIYEGIEGLKLNVSKLDVSLWMVCLEGVINPIIFISKLYKARSYVQLCRLDYGYEENPEETPKPNSHFMECQFKLNTLDISWDKRIIRVLKAIQGLTFTIDAEKIIQDSESGNMIGFRLDQPNVLVYLQGTIDPIHFISNFYKAGFHVRLGQICYRYEKNPEGSRIQNSHFMRCRFEVSSSDISWYMKITESLKVIQVVSFKIEPTIYAHPEIDAYHTVDLCGDVEIGVLMTMVERTGIELLEMKYGEEYKDENMKPPPKKLEDPANGTETRTGKETEPPPSEVVSTSTKHQVIYKKPRGLIRTIASLFCRPKNGTLGKEKR